MIGLDTNVLVRIFAADDLEQRATALRLIDGMAAGEKAVVNSIVVVELLWTLKRAYGFERDRLAAVVRNLTDHSRLFLPDKDLLREAAHRSREEGGDIPDHLIALTNRALGASTTYTFDTVAARSTDFSSIAG
jgi:predicted nucleic-acid-binding protein